MKSKSKTKTFFFVALVIMIISGGVYASFFVVMKYKIGSIVDISLRTKELSESEIQSTFSAFAINEESVNIEKLSTYYIKENDIVEFAKKIESLGPNSSTDLSIGSLDQQTGQNGAPVLGFRLKASGEFQNVMHLILMLENFPAQFEWRGVELVREDRSPAPVDSKSVPKATQRVETWRANISLAVLNFIKE